MIISLRSLTKQQYQNLIRALEIAGTMYGVMGDMVDEKFKKKFQENEELESFVLSFAKDFDMQNWVEEFDGKLYLKEKYADQVMQDKHEYEEFILYDLLSNKLAWRDFLREHSHAEIEELEKKNRGYFGVELYDYEEKYWDEFQTHGVERLEIPRENA